MTTTPATADSAAVPRDRRLWCDPLPGYAPVDATPPELQWPAVLDCAWAIDREHDPRMITDWPRRVEEAWMSYLVIGGCPYHPLGRTGRCGRDLPSWGENKAVDGLLIAGEGDKQQVLLIRRDDCEQWATPGGMVDPGETAPRALIREMREEIGYTPQVAEMLGVYCVDDPRATDHAWVVTMAWLMRTPEPVAVQPGDDAADARWWPARNMQALQQALDAEGEKLYEAHRPLLEIALTR